MILHIQNADGSYSSDQFINQESELIHDLQFIDVDNDGAEDIVSYDLTNGKIMVSYFNSSSNEYDKFEVLTDNFAYGIGGYSTSSPAASLMRLAYWDNDANIDLIYVFTQVGGGATATDQVNLVEDFLGARDTINLHTPSSSFASVHSIKLADIDNDNDLDAFLSIAGSRNDLWLENTGSSTVIEHFTGVIAGASYEFGDLNGDDFLDLVSIEALTGGTNARTTFSIYNPTTKQFEFSQDLTTGLYDVTFTFGDPDNDGDQDIIYARGSWYENTDGLGTMASGANLLDNGVGSIPKVGDFNNDGLDDVVYLGANSLGDGKFGVYLNNGDETYTTESFNGPGGIAPFQLVDLDNNGILDIIASGTINSSLSQPLWYKTCFNTSSTINATACDSYTAPSGAIFTSSGIYEDLIANSIGCDSLITIDLTINPTFNETASASICEGETYEFGTQTLDMTGEYTEIFQSQNNCDSTVVLTLTVNAVYNESVSAEICDGETFEFGTQTLIESGDYTELFESSLGCDSTVNLSLVVNPIYNESFSAEICDGETYEWEELSLKEAGDFTQVFESSLGCDSTVVLSLTLHPTFNESISVEICDGETYEFGSLTLMEPGEYTELFQSGDGCDSTVVLSLSVSETYSVQASQTICAGEEITFGDQTITESGSFTSTFQSSAGCDSLVTLAVDISPTFEETFEATICNNERFEFGTQTLTASGEYTELFSSSSGCDSTVVLTLTVNTTIEEDTEVTICAGETYTFGNQSLTTGGTYSEIFTSSLGCDSTVNLTLNLLNSHEESAEIAICNGESYDFGGTLLTEAGVYSNNFQTSEGCDSLVNLTLNVNTVYQVDSQLTICENATFVFGDQVLNQSGAYEFTFGSSLGCDSTVNLSLTVNPSIESTIDLSICDGETFSFGSQTLSEGGTYSELFSSTNQCDSLVNLNLTVINLDASVQNGNGTLTTNQMEGTFQWINCDNGYSLIDGATSRTFSPDFGGNYAVIISNKGCDVTSECISFSMENPLNVTGSQEIAFYPVPTDGELIVELKDRTFSGEVRISNLAGQIVYQKRFINESKLMNHFHLASGTYILHLIDHSQQVLRTKRVLIKDN
ncbi:MAG: FG-GAP-like repeat-containing protein [Cytophagales bacterium]|nr:FG-GAP-like repeat-containing protein [Cytophagales bacterium]